MVRLENENLLVEIKERGAELVRVKSKNPGIDYLWDGGSQWPKHSPLLFPIVGTLKNNQYWYRNSAYELPRHGFARERDFTVENAGNTHAAFVLTHNEDSLRVYPFQFRLTVLYQLAEQQLSVEYKVENPGSDEMYFSVGGHPAFRLPLTSDTVYEDYSLHFEKLEKVGRWQIVDGGLLAGKSTPLLEGADTIPLRKELFYQDAIVLKGLKSNTVSIRSEKTPHGLDFDFHGFPYLGIWGAKDADFVCIEPWCGIADSVGTSQLFEDKEGINKLLPGEQFSRTWKIRLY